MRGERMILVDYGHIFELIAGQFVLANCLNGICVLCRVCWKKKAPASVGKILVVLPLIRCK